MSKLNRHFTVWIHSFGFELFIYIRMRLCVCVFFYFFLVRWYKNIFTIEWFDVQCSESIEKKRNQKQNARILFKQQIYVIVIFDQFPLNSFFYGLNPYVALCLVFNFTARYRTYVCTFLYSVVLVSDSLETFSLDWPNRSTISFPSFATEYKSNANRNETTKWRKDKIQMCYVLSL